MTRERPLFAQSVDALIKGNVIQGEVVWIFLKV